MCVDWTILPTVYLTNDRKHRPLNVFILLLDRFIFALYVFYTRAYVIASEATSNRRNTYNETNDIHGCCAHVRLVGKIIQNLNLVACDRGVVNDAWVLFFRCKSIPLFYECAYQFLINSDNNILNFWVILWICFIIYNVLKIKCFKISCANGKVFKFHLCTLYTHPCLQQQHINNEKFSQSEKYREMKCEKS